jgi:hypothetical protein
VKTQARVKLITQNFDLGPFSVWFSMDFSVLSEEGELSFDFDESPTAVLDFVKSDGSLGSTDFEELPTELQSFVEEKIQAYAKNWTKERQDSLDWQSVEDEENGEEN